MRALVAAAAAVLVLSACQDPAGVGLGLIDEEQLDPNAVPVPLSGFALVDDSTVAIGIAQANPAGALSQPRVIVGSVADPAFGDVASVGYVDFLQPDLPDGTEAGDVSEAWLVLSRTYAYGDTTTALPIELREINGDWEASSDYAPDTLFSVGPVISTTTVVVGDTLPRFDLPDAWLRANAGRLVASDFSTAFEGFALQVPAAYTPTPGVAWGFRTFDSFGSGLRVVVGEDTLNYPLSEVFSSIDANAASAPPAGAAAARAGSQAALRFEVDLTALGTAALAQAQLQLPVQASLAEDGPFVRPLVVRAFLFGIRGAGDTRTRTLVSEVFLVDGIITATEPTALTARFQEILLGSTEPFDFFEVVPDPTQASLSILPATLPTADPASPRLTLTVVGAQ